jgi:hypothetical protein
MCDDDLIARFIGWIRDGADFDFYNGEAIYEACCVAVEGVLRGLGFEGVMLSQHAAIEQEVRQIAEQIAEEGKEET